MTPVVVLPLRFPGSIPGLAGRPYAGPPLRATTKRKFSAGGFRAANPRQLPHSFHSNISTLKGSGRPGACAVGFRRNTPDAPGQDGVVAHAGTAVHALKRRSNRPGRRHGCRRPDAPPPAWTPPAGSERAMDGERAERRQARQRRSQRKRRRRPRPQALDKSRTCTSPSGRDLSAKTLSGGMEAAGPLTGCDGSNYAGFRAPFGALAASKVTSPKCPAWRADSPPRRVKTNFAASPPQKCDTRYCGRRRPGPKMSK